MLALSNDAGRRLLVKQYTVQLLHRGSLLQPRILVLVLAIHLNVYKGVITYTLGICNPLGSFLSIGGTHSDRLLRV